VRRRIDSVSRGPRERNEVINEPAAARIKISRGCCWNFQGWWLPRRRGGGSRKPGMKTRSATSGGCCRPRWKRGGGTGERGWWARWRTGRGMGYHPRARLSTTEIPFLAIYHEEGRGRGGLVGWFQMIPDFSGVNKEGEGRPGKVKWISPARPFFVSFRQSSRFFPHLHLLSLTIALALAGVILSANHRRHVSSDTELAKRVFTRGWSLLEKLLECYVTAAKIFNRNCQGTSCILHAIFRGWTSPIIRVKPTEDPARRAITR